MRGSFASGCASRLAVRRFSYASISSGERLRAADEGVGVLLTRDEVAGLTPSAAVPLGWACSLVWSCSRLSARRSHPRPCRASAFGSSSLLLTRAATGTACLGSCTRARPALGGGGGDMPPDLLITPGLTGCVRLVSRGGVSRAGLLSAMLSGRFPHWPSACMVCSLPVLSLTRCSMPAASSCCCIGVSALPVFLPGDLFPFIRRPSLANLPSRCSAPPGST